MRLRCFALLCIPLNWTSFLDSWLEHLLSMWAQIHFVSSLILLYVALQGLPEAVGSAVAGSIRNTIQSQYDEVFRAVVLPAFERSTQEMFRQVDDAFRRGINECECSLVALSGHFRCKKGCFHYSCTMSCCFVGIDSSIPQLVCVVQLDT